MPAEAEPAQQPARILILGAGAFGTAVAAALAHGEDEIAVHVAARNLQAAQRTCTVASYHAAAAGSAAAFTPHRLDLTGEADLHILLGRLRPDAVAVCVSHQSPEEVRGQRTAWSELLREAGFGLALPLHADLLLRIAAACAQTSQTAVINACFPDAVNPLARAAGLPVFCGVGNISTLATAVAATMNPEDRPKLRMIAHHAHLHATAHPDDEAAAWTGEIPITDLAARLARIRSLPAGARNELGAWSAAPVIRAAARAGRPWTGHVPGPRGLPGGYPVLINGRHIEVRAPENLGLDGAIEFNERAAALDGVRVEQGRARLTDQAYQAVQTRWPTAPREFTAEDVKEVCGELLALRDQLRDMAPTR